MKNIKYIIFFIVISIFAVTCKNAEEIRNREKSKATAHEIKIVKAVKPNNLGIIKKMSVAEFNTVINNKTGILVDVRTLDEFTEGHLKGAVNIDFKKRTFPDYINAIDKNKPVLIYCRSGNRSGKAALIMQSLGFKEIYDLGKGYKGWHAEKMEVVKTDNNENKKLQKLVAKNEIKGNTIAGKSHQVDVDEFEKLIKEHKVTLVDVRTAKEYASGHIEGAVNVDWKDRHFAKNILKITDEKPVAIYCRSGNRATRAMHAMSAIGFKEVYNLDQGIKSWGIANKPLKTLEVKGNKHHLDVENFNNAILGKVGTLIDIRTKKEYDDYHLPEAKMIDFKSDNFKSEFAKLDKEVPVLIYCRSGGRSGRATKVLTEMGFQVYNLDKGINQWKSKGMKLKGKNIHAKQHGEEGC